MNIIYETWPWYFTGPMIGLTLLLLLFLGKSFGVSSSFRHICASAGAGNHSSFFDYDWKDEAWNLLFVGGALLGGIIAALWLGGNGPTDISPATVESLSALGVQDFSGLAPTDLFSWNALTSLPGLALMIGGGFLVGFGARYAGGCTSGHAITGLSNLQLPSLIAVIGFFIGGLTITHLILPWILQLKTIV